MAPWARKPLSNVLVNTNNVHCSLASPSTAYSRLDLKHTDLSIFTSVAYYSGNLFQFTIPYEIMCIFLCLTSTCILLKQRAVSSSSAGIDQSEKHDPAVIATDLILTCRSRQAVGDFPNVRPIAIRI